MMKTLPLCALLLVASCTLGLSNARIHRKLNANPQDALGFYDNPFIPPALKNLLDPVVLYIPNPPNDPFFPPDSKNDPAPTPPTTNFPWIPFPNFPNPFAPAPPIPKADPTSSNPSPSTPSTPHNPPTNPTPATPNPPASSGGSATIVYQGAGGGFNNGESDSWWYKIDSNGVVYTSPNFDNDPNIPAGVKQQVQNMSNYIKHGGHP